MRGMETNSHNHRDVKQDAPSPKAMIPHSNTEEWQQTAKEGRCGLEGAVRYPFHRQQVCFLLSCLIATHRLCHLRVAFTVQQHMATHPQPFCLFVVCNLAASATRRNAVICAPMQVTQKLSRRLTGDASKHGNSCCTPFGVMVELNCFICRGVEFRPTHFSPPT